MDEELITGAALEILSQGPLALSELAQRLIQRGLLEEGYDEDELIETLDDEVWLDDDVVHSIPALTEGRRFTHRLTPEEKALGRLIQFPDFAGLWLQHEESAQRRGVSHFSMLDDEFVQWVASADADWLAPFAPGELIQVIRNDGALVVAACEEPGDGREERRAIAELHERFVETKVSGDAEDFMLYLLAGDPGLFRSPQPPLGEMFVACRIPVVGAQIEGVDSRLDDHFMAILSDLYEFDRCCRQALRAIKSAFAFWRVPELRDQVDLAAAARNLAHSQVASAFADLFLETKVGGEPAFREFAEALAKVKGERAAAGMYLLGCVNDVSLDLDRARAGFSMAHMRDPGYQPAIEALARLAADRGDAAEARSLYGRSTLVWAREEAEVLDKLLGADLPKVGRNDACPCGSGKKYKACHEGMRATLTPEQRHAWLMRKIAQFPRRPGNGLRMATEVSHLGELLDPEHEGLLEDAMVVDVMAWDDRNLSAYHTRRGPILPPEDAVVVSALAESRRDLWVVAASDPGRRLTLGNVRRGEQVEVEEGRGAVDYPAGSNLLVRVVELPSGTWLYGMVYPVPEEEVQEVLAMLEEGMDSWDLVDWYTEGSSRPGAMSNTSGEEIVFCSVTARLPDPGAAAMILDRHLEKGGDGAWVEKEDSELMEGVIVGTFKIQGDLLAYGANSLQRFARISKRVEELLGNLEIVEQRFTPLAEALAEHREGSGEAPAAPQPPDSPAMQAQFQEIMQMAELKWLDQPVPALSGRTPRQAAADPVLRGDLERLLAKFARDEARLPAGAAGFSATRLRALLGL
ncbi:MAG: SEC-C metal-binding domain-containing protein [Actinomycetota bacterium]|nr:SEC-C metal-binding domain-containing protein [Actinomycetota bacterium]